MKITKEFEFSPTDEYFSQQYDCKGLDLLLSRMQNATIMTGFNDPTSLQVPYAPLSPIVLPEAS